MIEPLICPSCDSRATERVHRTHSGDTFEETYICNDCPAQYTVSYEAFEKEADSV